MLNPMLVIGTMNTKKFFYIQIFLFEHGECRQCVFACVCLCECGTWIVSKDEDLKDVFLLLCYEDGNCHFLSFKMHTVFES